MMAHQPPFALSLSKRLPSQVLERGFDKLSPNGKRGSVL